MVSGHVTTQAFSKLLVKKKRRGRGGTGDTFPGPQTFKGPHEAFIHDFYLYGLHLPAGSIKNLLINNIIL